MKKKNQALVLSANPELAQPYYTDFFEAMLGLDTVAVNPIEEGVEKMTKHLKDSEVFLVDVPEDARPKSMKEAVKEFERLAGCKEYPFSQARSAINVVTLLALDDALGNEDYEMLATMKKQYKEFSGEDLDFDEMREEMLSYGETKVMYEAMKGGAL